MGWGAGGYTFKGDMQTRIIPNFLYICVLCTRLNDESANFCFLRFQLSKTTHLNVKPSHQHQIRQLCPITLTLATVGLLCFFICRIIIGDVSPNISTTVMISAISMSLTLLIVFIALAIYKVQKKKTKARHVVTQDINPVYGHYYSSEGVRLDQSTVEVRDQNDLYYEQQYEN